MWFFILVPFGICRTVLRPIFNEMSIVGPSEPILNMFPLSPVVPIVVLDILWAIVCSFLFIFLGHTAHEKFIQDNLKICSSFSEEFPGHVMNTAVVIEQILIVVTTVDMVVDVDFAFSIVVVTVVMQFAIV